MPFSNIKITLLSVMRKHFAWILYYKRRNWTLICFFVLQQTIPYGTRFTVWINYFSSWNKFVVWEIFLNPHSLLEFNWAIKELLKFKIWAFKKWKVSNQYDSKKILMFNHLLNQCSVLDSPSPPLGHLIVLLPNGKVLHRSNDVLTLLPYDLFHLCWFFKQIF